MVQRVTRRRLLRISGTGMVGTGFAGHSSADRPQRIFVLPSAAADQEDLADAVKKGQGRVRFQYTHFPFIAASIPQNHLRDLRNDKRVNRVEEDPELVLHDHKDGHEKKDQEPAEQRCEDHPPEDPSWGYDRIGAADAHEYATGAGVDVAIIDSGIQSNHCDFEGGVETGPRCVKKGTLEDEYGHGTKCAGIVGARKNERGVVGVAPDARLHSVKVFGQGSNVASALLCGLDWCIENEIEIISMSLGAKAKKDETKEHPVETAAKVAYRKGHLLVGSAGNDGNDQDGECRKPNVGTPAALPEVIAVSAMERPGYSDYELAYFSSVGPQIELMAPGLYVRTTDIRNQYSDFHGTSASCPHVAGAAALAWEQLPSSGPNTQDRDTIRQTLQATAEPILGVQCEEGHGLVRPDRLTAALADENTG